MKYVIFIMIFALGYCVGLLSDNNAVQHHKMGTVLIDDRFDDEVKFRFVFEKDIEEIPEASYILFDTKIDHNLGGKNDEFTIC